MESSIMKILDEDEDENMHSGADVEAFTAALNRDIGGGRGEILVSQSVDSAAGTSSLTSEELIGQKQASGQGDGLSHQDQKQEQQNVSLPQEQPSSDRAPMPKGSIPETQNTEDGLLVESGKLMSQYNRSQEEHHHPKTETATTQSSEGNQIHVPEKDPVQPLKHEGILHSGNQHPPPKPPQLNSQQTPVADNRSNEVRRIPFYLVLPMLRPHLDKDRAMQLEAIFNKLRKNEVDKEGFLRLVRNIVGDQMLRMAVHQIQMQAEGKAAGPSQSSPSSYQIQSQPSLQQLHKTSSSSQQLSETQPLLKHHSSPSDHLQKGLGAPAHPSQIPVSSALGQAVPNRENISEMSMEGDRCSDAQMTHGSQILPSNTNIMKVERERIMVSATPTSKQLESHLASSSFPMYGNAVGNYSAHAYSGPSISTGTSIPTQDGPMKPVTHLQGGIVSNHLGTSQSKNPMNMPRYELRSKITDNNRVQSGPVTHLLCQPSLPQSPGAWQSSRNKETKNDGPSPIAYPKQEHDQMPKQQLNARHLAPTNSSFVPALIDQGNSSVGPFKEDVDNSQSARMGFPTSSIMMGANQIPSPALAQPDSSQISSAATPAGSGATVKTPPKKQTAGQKRPVEAAGTLSPISSKKQKVTGAPLDQSIEHLNDVTAVSGVNLREEEEQLLSAPKEDNRASEATRRAVQEEEEKLILQRAPLQKKITEIITKCGLKGVGNDVERCLSMSVEERLCGLISSLIRLSKQRVDVEKSRHRHFITSDIRQQILMMNRKAKEEWEKKQAEEAEKLRKNNEAEGSVGIDAEKDKEEARSKVSKVNKEEDDKMRTTAANVAARAAVGGDDMLSKWQLMAEQARQKREWLHDGAPSSVPARDPSHISGLTSGNTSRDSQESENRGQPVGAAASGSMRKSSKNLASIPQAKVVRTISVKDVISVLEREPQMSKSTLLYRLYERDVADAVAK